MIKSKVGQLDLSGWPVPDEYLVEIGRIALVWAGLEDFLYSCIGKLAGYEDLSDPRVLTIVSHADFDSNLKLLEKLCAQLLSSHRNLAPYPDVISALRDAESNKDMYLHGKMAPNPGTGIVEVEITDIVDGVLQRQDRAVTIGQLREVLLEIDEAQHQLYKLTLAVEHISDWKHVIKPT